MASGTRKKGNKDGVKAARASVVTKKGPPWGTIIAVIAVLLVAGGVFTYAFIEISGAKKFTASDDNKDPSVNIAGVVRQEYPAAIHVSPEQRVAYDQSPPYGGPHDGVWADCTGVVYPTAVRSESMVHALEHGAVWIAYDPARVQGGELDKLKGKVDGQPYMLMSPYPGLDKPISLQSWGHQLKLDSADDERVDQFIKSLRTNSYQNPEPGGRCDSNQTGFDPTMPPPFAAEPPGPGAVPMDGTGAGETAPQGGATQPPVVPSTPAPAGQ